MREEMTMFNRVAILGLGLIGGSIGLALHKAKVAQQVVGYDLGKGVMNQARKVGAIDQPYSALADAVRGSELIILAPPLAAMKALLQDIPSSELPGPVVTDIPRTKVHGVTRA